MGGAIGKFFCIITGRETPNEKAKRAAADAALASIEKTSQEFSQVAEDTHIWAEKVKKHSTERKAEQARKANESAAQPAVAGNGEAAHG